ncbi:DUF1707 domain-containing protein [Saccharopolyspora indica]|uniref:DUF1707 SHOCT-like domain-containing protein n=1 Tax=Saccharopolyspora indica TaxID=1229659 RepID=UPI0022EB74EC|nr:DUF1707 domain-containing protein [Saccharopolyspora indica]MDA3649736.1 DUF1707 domain-containing protein [Saccharopolyspora indica]
MTSDLPESAHREMRASNADRDAVVQRLQEAAGEGRIDLTELTERVDRALAAKTYADLEPLTADLPSGRTADPGKPLFLKGGLHGASRTGRWQVPAQITAHGGMGGVKLDFTQADCRLPLIELEAHGQMAGVTIVIPEGWSAETDEVEPGLGGLKDKTTPDRQPGAPLVRLSGSGGAAGVVIRHPNGWERRKLRRGR